MCKFNIYIIFYVLIISAILVNGNYSKQRSQPCNSDKCLIPANHLLFSVNSSYVNSSGDEEKTEDNISDLRLDIFHPLDVINDIKRILNISDFKYLLKLLHSFDISNLLKFKDKAIKMKNLINWNEISKRIHWDKIVKTLHLNDIMISLKRVSAKLAMETIHLPLKVVLGSVKIFTSRIVQIAIRVALKMTAPKYGTILTKYLEILMNFFHLIAETALKSKFFVSKATVENFKFMFSDISIKFLELILYNVNQILNSAKRLFEPIFKSPIIEDDNERNSTFANKFLVSFHSFMKKTADGLYSLSMTSVDNLPNYIRSLNSSNLLLLQSAYVLVNIYNIIQNVSDEILDTKFLMENPSWENLEPFLEDAIKSVVITSIRGFRDLLEQCLIGLLNERDLPVNITYDSSLIGKPTPGDAIRLIDDGILAMMNSKILNILHRVTYVIVHAIKNFTKEDVTLSIIAMLPMPGKVGITIFKTFHSYYEWADKLSQKDFLSKPPPTWKSAVDFIRESIQAISVSLQQKMHDVQSWKLIPIWSAVFLRYIFLKSALESFHNNLKSITEVAISLSKPKIGRIFRDILQDSGLPYQIELGNAFYEIISFVHNSSTVIITSEFLSHNQLTTVNFLNVLNCLLNGIITFILKLLKHVLGGMELFLNFSPSQN